MTSRKMQVGRLGENAACEWYETNGYKVAARNWRVPEGEIDLIAVDANGTTVVFCEVKTRTTSAFGSGAEAVTWRKQKQVRKLALLWLQHSDEHFDELRFDVADVDGEGHVVVIEGCF